MPNGHHAESARTEPGRIRAAIEGGIFLQPRLEAWFDWHKRSGSLPEQYGDLSVRELYQDLGVSSRYFSHFTGLAEPVKTCYDECVRVKSEIVAERGKETKVTVYETALGDLVEKRIRTVDGVWRKVDFAVKTVEDLERLQWLFGHALVHFDAGAFSAGDRYQADLGQPQFWICGSPYETVTQEWMAFEDFMYALADVPERMQQLFDVIDRSYDCLFEQIVAHADVRIVNFPENIHVARTPPRYFERYLLPWYEKRSTQLRDRGIFTHIHIDGDFGPLLTYLEDLPFDGLEALTPRPQGDVTLEQIREHIGEKILLDGIPAVLFLRHHSPDELQECVDKLVEYFHPRLVLGISDELPQGGDAESLERVRWVADYLRTIPMHVES